MRRLLPVALLMLSLPVSARTLGSLEFTPCDIGRAGTGATVRAECATLDVPEDPARPDGRKIALRVAMLPSRAAEPAADPLIFFAGGPGQSAVDSLATVAPGLARVREKRHLLFMDQRGTGGSNPLACKLPMDAELATPSAEMQVEMAEDCRDSLDADLAQYTTTVAAADVEALRQAIGAPKLNLYGGSYGTRMAQEYARQRPDAVRSIVLDGVVPPGLALGSEHAINLEAALKQILGRCAEQAGCAKAFGDPYRTLYTLRDQARATPLAVTLRDPLTHEPRELRLDEGAVALIARLFAYAPETAALLPLLLDEAAKGRPESLVAQAALVFDSLSGEINHGMQLSVMCAEDAPRLQARPEDQDLVLGEAIISVSLNQCSVWPKGPVSPGFHEPLATDIPTLLLSGEYDPVTPPRYGEEVLKSLGKARHLVGAGQGHIMLSRGCTPRLVGQFIDKLDPEGLDASCLEPLGATPFFINYNGAEP
ncbi:alpha/beta fold hydrolase [Arenimonas sp.]|uniref:alpha/beta fold hydrolase n=1 Tax=Arenimonas sp. TaxID=1872635 RepID=UPI002E30CF39|nr:alpha/beta fold hydrolase [Arenimonas sp.]HEX4854270.1 alpha/beta fold hydrolase [Arenimonas sp.]